MFFVWKNTLITWKFSPYSEITSNMLVPLAFFLNSLKSIGYIEKQIQFKHRSYKGIVGGRDLNKRYRLKYQTCVTFDRKTVVIYLYSIKKVRNEFVFRLGEDTQQRNNKTQIYKYCLRILNVT